MLESKPEKSSLLGPPKMPTVSSGTKEGLEKVQCLALDRRSKHDSELVDELFVPPRDPRNLNKFLRKQVKDATGKSWYVECGHQTTFLGDMSY